MRLNTLTVGRFKNLRDLRVDFDEESPYTVLVGENGSGKSNLIEALTLIFRALDLDEPAPFAYELSYRCRGSEIRIHAEDARTPRFWAKAISVDGEPPELSKTRFMQEDEQGRPKYRPAFVFGYYSGPSDRLSSLYDKHRERYYRLIIQPQGKRSKQAAQSNVLRRLFYAQNLHDSSRCSRSLWNQKAAPPMIVHFSKSTYRSRGSTRCCFVFDDRGGDAIAVEMEGFGTPRARLESSWADCTMQRYCPSG